MTTKDDLTDSSWYREVLGRSTRGWRGARAICALALTLLAGPAMSETPSDTCETRVLTLEYLDPVHATMLARSMFQSREVEERPDESAVAMTSTPAYLDAMERLLEEIDVAPPRWKVALLAGGGTAKQVLSGEITGDEPLVFELEDEAAGTLRASFEVDIKKTSATELVFWSDIASSLTVAGRDRPVRSVERTRATLVDGDEFVVLRPATSGLRQALGRLVGVDQEVAELSVRIDRREGETSQAGAPNRRARSRTLGAATCDRESYDSLREIRVLHLRYLSSKQAVATLRTTLQVRQIAESRDTGYVVLHDDLAVVEAASKLLRELDAPKRGRTADLVLETTEGEIHLRPVALDKDALILHYGDSDSGDVRMIFGFDEWVTSRSILVRDGFAF